MYEKMILFFVLTAVLTLYVAKGKSLAKRSIPPCNQADLPLQPFSTWPCYGSPEDFSSVPNQQELRLDQIPHTETIPLEPGSFLSSLCLPFKMMLSNLNSFVSIADFIWPVEDEPLVQPIPIWHPTKLDKITNFESVQKAKDYEKRLNET